MARIRSVHPGLWTDEAFVEMTVHARLFLIGIWNEADDCGLLQWRPTRLKMRLAPADTIDAEAVMDELVRFGFLVRFSRGGIEYAAVKNFRKFQRPKNPSAPILPLDDELRTIVGIKEGDSPTPALPQPFPERAEKVEQMEDGVGGDKREKEAAAAASLAAAAEKSEMKEIAAVLEDATGGWVLPGVHLIRDLMAKGHSLTERIEPLAKESAATFRRLNRPKPESWAYLVPIVEDNYREPAQESKASKAAQSLVKVPQSATEWGPAAERFRVERGKPPPVIDGFSWFPPHMVQKVA